MSYLGGGSAPRTTRKSPPARPPAPLVVTIGPSARNDAEPPGRDLLGWSLRSFSGRAVQVSNA
eukprot:15441932-Alexandrium_andersonii.AAC.1